MHFFQYFVLHSSVKSTTFAEFLETEEVFNKIMAWFLQ